MTRSGGGASRRQPPMLWTRPPDPPDPATLAPRRVLLASEGGRFAPEAVAFAARLAAPTGAPVHVLSIARVWGTALGFPNPNLYPSKQEWDQQRDLVGEAVRLLESRGLKATGQVIGTRNAAGRIIGAARQGAATPSSWPPSRRATGWSPTFSGLRSRTACAGGPSCRSISCRLVRLLWRVELPKGHP